jgi:hypothetical protein
MHLMKLTLCWQVKACILVASYNILGENYCSHLQVLSGLKMMAVVCSDTIWLATATLHCVTFHKTLLSPIPAVNTYRLACVINGNTQNMILIRSEIVGNSTGDHVVQWFPASGRDTSQGRGGSDIGLREGFVENLIVMDLSNFYLEANNLCDQHMYELFK